MADNFRGRWVQQTMFAKQHWVQFHGAAKLKTIQSPGLNQAKRVKNNAQFVQHVNTLWVSSCTTFSNLTVVQTEIFL